MEEVAHAEPLVRRSENDTRPIIESDTVDATEHATDATVRATVPKRSVNPNCVPKPQSYWVLLAVVEE